PQGLDEAIAPFARPAVVGKAGEPEVMKPALEEMLGAQVADHDIVRTDLWHAGKGRRIVEIDEREPEFLAGVDEFERGVPADDTVPVFAPQPVMIAFRAR